MKSSTAKNESDFSVTFITVSLPLSLYLPPSLSPSFGKLVWCFYSTDFLYYFYYFLFAFSASRFAYFSSGVIRSSQLLLLLFLLTFKCQTELKVAQSASRHCIYILHIYSQELFPYDLYWVMRVTWKTNELDSGISSEVATGLDFDYGPVCNPLKVWEPVKRGRGGVKRGLPISCETTKRIAQFLELWWEIRYVLWQFGKR